MNNKIYKRILLESNYILNNNMTIRQIASKVKISKSTVHKDLHERLKDLNKELFDKVDIVLKRHLKMRHINGGLSTKLKYQKLRKG